MFHRLQHGDLLVDLADLRAGPGADLTRIPRDHVHGRARQVHVRAGAKIREIDEKIAMLQAMKRRLGAIVRCRCDGRCPIVAAATHDSGGRP